MYQDKRKSKSTEGQTANKTTDNSKPINIPDFCFTEGQTADSSEPTNIPHSYPDLQTFSNYPYQYFNEAKVPAIKTAATDKGYLT